MSIGRMLFDGLRSLFRRGAADRDLDDEVQHYLEMATQEYMRGGLPRDAAERAARVQFGGIEAAKEGVRDAGWEARVESVIRDLRYAVRTLANTPAFTATAILTLALGIGANTAMFSVVNATLLRPLPYLEADRLATLWTDDPRHGDKEEGTSNPTFLDWRAQSRAFADMAVCSRGNPVMFGGADPERLDAEEISANMLPLLGVRPLLGRNFTADEEQRREVTAILSYGLWQRRFAGSREVIGTTIELDRRPIRVVGVMPRGFFFPTERTQLWLTANPDDRERTVRTTDTWRVVGRLRPGATFGQAQAELTGIGERLARSYPWNDPGFAGYGVNVVPMLQQVTGTSLPFVLWLLLGAVACVLAIACANVANLVLVRGTVRAHELAVRTALGASRGRLTRQLLAESAVLGTAAAVAGVGIAVVGLRVVGARLVSALPRASDVHVDGYVLAVTATCSLVATALFGLAPALRAARTDPIDALKDRARRGGAGVATRRMGGALVVVECALAVILLAGAALLVRSISRLNAVDAGFRPESALLARVSLPPETAEEVDHTNHAGDRRMVEIIKRLTVLPGVERAGAMRDFVFAKNPDWVVTPEHFVGPVPPGGELTSEEVSPGVFAALGATLVAGREFTDRDMGGPASAVINESFANRYFPGVNATGKRFKEGGPDSRPRWITVIGVVRDLHRGGLERPTLPEYYSLWIPSTVDIVLRTRGDPETVARSVRAAARSIQPLAAIARIVPLEDEFGATGAQRRMQTSLLVAFAVLALLMAAIGIYGVMNYVVSGRTQEIGVRMALGARVTDALSLVIGDGMRLAFTGVAIGVAGALGLTGLMTHLVFGIGARDPISIAAGALVLLAVSFIACYVPARRAARIDPVIALREQ